MKYRTVVILLSVAIATIMCITIPMPIYNYYTYTVPMKDPLIDYVVADFHYPRVENQDFNFYTMKSITLLADGSIDVGFRPNTKYMTYDGLNFTHVQNIKVGQTFVISCMREDYGNETVHIIPSYEELKNAIDAPTLSYIADEKYFENNCNNDPDEEGCNRLYNAFLNNSTIGVQESYGYARPYLDKEFYDKPFVNILKYMGLGEIDDKQVYAFHHVDGYLRNNVSCDYPQVIKYSIDLVDLDIPDWFLCTFPEAYRPSLILDDFQESRCAPYKDQ